MATASSSSLPLLSLSVKLKTETESFTHTHEFMIVRDQIFYRIKSTVGNAWSSLAFSEDRIPIQLSADGANLVVLDNKRKVHYMKIITELRGPAQDYMWADIKGKKWERAWFTLPLVSTVFNLVFGNEITIPKANNGWAISHRGQLIDDCEDTAGKKHIDTTGVTTLYTLAQGGKSLHYADPWLPGGFL